MSLATKEINGKKQWRAVVSSYDVYGKRHQKVSGWFNRKADAQAAETKLKASASTERIGKTFGEVCMEWIMATKEENTAKTHTDKIHMLNTYMLAIKDMKLDKIRPATLKKLFQEPEFLELGTSRKNRVRGIIASTFKYAMNMYNFPTNPVDAFPSFKRSDDEKMRQRVIYTPAQFMAMVDAVDANKHWEYRSILIMLFLTGMRLNECLSLTFGDMRGKGKIHIWRQMMKDGWHTLKTENSERTIALNKDCQQIIEKQLSYYSDMPMFDESWFIFGGPQKIPENTLRNIANAAQKKAGLPHCRIHDLRHAHASILLQNMNGEGDILKVSKRLGHSSVNTTLEIYAHIMDKSEEDVVSVLDSLF